VQEPLRQSRGADIEAVVPPDACACRKLSFGSRSRAGLTSIPSAVGEASARSVSTALRDLRHGPCCEVEDRAQEPDDCGDPVGPKNSNQREIVGLSSVGVVRTDANLVPILYLWVPETHPR
jgi:hypothetical protein